MFLTECIRDLSLPLLCIAERHVDQTLIWLEEIILYGCGLDSATLPLKDLKYQIVYKVRFYSLFENMFKLVLKMLFAVKQGRMQHSCSRCSENFTFVFYYYFVSESKLIEMCISRIVHT